VDRIESSYSPSKEFRYWLYDPEGDGTTYYKSKEDQSKAAEVAIARYLDDEWSDEVTRVAAGEVTHLTMMVDKQEPEGEIDEETREDEAGTYWPRGIDYTCNYKLLPLDK
jgi:hypothetical protein